LPAENFPNVSESAIESEFTIAQNVLKNMITKTHFSMGQKDVRFFLNGMLFDLTEDAFHVVSSDGHRLSNAMWRLPVASPLVTKIIVPRKGVMELTRILADTDQEIKIMVSSNHLRAETENFTFISRLLDGKFPDYRQVVGLSKDKIVTVEREKLKEVLIRASVLSSEKSRGVRLLITPDILKIFTSNTEQEEAYDELPISYYGAELEICFNVNYLLDACNALQDEKIELRFSTDNSSVHIVGNDAAKYVYVVMPIKI
jgi:DNA polymerase-3 subunit beta